MTIEIMLWLFLSFAVGLLIGYMEGLEQGWEKCGRLYREEVLPLTHRGKKK